MALARPQRPTHQLVTRSYGSNAAHIHHRDISSNYADNLTVLSNDELPAPPVSVSVRLISIIRIDVCLVTLLIIKWNNNLSLLIIVKCLILRKLFIKLFILNFAIV